MVAGEQVLGLLWSDLLGSGVPLMGLLWVNPFVNGLLKGRGICSWLMFKLAPCCQLLQK